MQIEGGVYYIYCLEHADHVSILRRLRELVVGIVNIRPPHVLVDLVRLLAPRRRNHVDLDPRVPVSDQLHNREEQQVLVHAAGDDAAAHADVSSDFGGEGGQLHVVAEGELEEAVGVARVVGGPRVLVLLALGKEAGVLRVGVLAVVERVEPGVLLLGVGGESGVGAPVEGLLRGGEGFGGELRVGEEMS